MINLIDKAKDLENRINRINSSLDTVTTPTTVYDMVDLYPTHKERFNESAQEALARKTATQQIYQRKVELDSNNYVMETDICRYFTIHFNGERNIPKAVEKLAIIINKHAELNHIVRPLTGLGLLKLNQIDLCSRDRYAVFSFLIFNPEGQKALDSAKYPEECLEDQLPELTNFDDVDPIEVRLGEGEFFAEIRVSTLYHTSVNIQEIVDEHIQRYIAVLPKGTEIVETKQLSITSSLLIPYEVKFKNPLMNRYKEVRLLSHREATVVGDELKEFSLLDRIEYIKKNQYGQIDS